MKQTSNKSMKRDTPSLVHRGRPDFQLLVLTLLLVGFGIVMVYSASYSLAAVSDAYNRDAFHFVKRQMIWAVLGLIAMLVAMRIPYKIYRLFIMPAFLISIIMLILVQFIGVERNGARSWFEFGFISIQPSELAKITTILYLAALISKKGERFRDLKKGLIPVIFIAVFVSALIFSQNDTGSALILLGTAGFIILAGGANLKHITLGLLSLGILGVVGLSIVQLVSTDGLMNNYRFDRIASWLDPFHDPQHASYNLLESLKAIAHGGWTGAGFGQSIQKLFYLPYPYNDFIFAVIAEELGFIATTLFLAAYVYFIWRGLLISMRCPDIFGTLMGVGIIANIAVQAFVNIGGVTRTIPITGVTLPFISYGGSSLLIVMTSVGMLLSISRESARVDQPKTISSQTRTTTASKKDYRPLRPL